MTVTTVVGGALLVVSFAMFVVPVLSTFFPAATAIAIFSGLPVWLQGFFLGTAVCGPVLAAAGYLMVTA